MPAILVIVGIALLLSQPPRTDYALNQFLRVGERCACYTCLFGALPGPDFGGQSNVPLQPAERPPVHWLGLPRCSSALPSCVSDVQSTSLYT